MYQIAQIHIPGIQILKELGRSGSQIMYLAQRDGQLYALKIPAPYPARNDEILLQFRREGAALALIQHPALADIVEIGQTDFGPYMLMEFIRGNTLRTILDTQPWNHQEVVQAAKILASALASVHREGIVHRDLQPRNIMLDDQGNLRIVDFGMLGYTDEHTLSSQTLGTLHYSAPEQTGIVKRPVDGRSDLYALGAILYECLAGVPPFIASHAAEIVRLHAVAAPPSLRMINPAISPTLNAIIFKLLAKDPDDRYQTAEGLISDLEHLEEFDRMFEAGHPLQLGLDDHRVAALYERAMVGREYELKLLREAWNTARQGQGNVIIIEGSFGCGKSHLAREILHRASSEGGLVLETHCIKGMVTPFYIVRSLMRQYFLLVKTMPFEQRTQALHDLRDGLSPIGQRIFQIIPGLANDLELKPEMFGSVGVEQANVYQTLAAMIQRILRVYPGSMWLIDDLHYIDESSFSVLSALLDVIHQEPCVVLLVMDDEHQSPYVQERLLSQQVARYQALRLEPLDMAQTHNMISSSLGGYHVEERLVQEITLRSGGNPFAIQEYVQTILDAGLLRLLNQTWSIAPEDYKKLQLPQQIVPLLLRRVDQLPLSAKAILQAAALIGFEFSREDLELVCDGAVNEVNTAVSIALKDHILERSRAGMYRFVHEQVQTALLSRLDHVGLRNLHLHIAKVFDRSKTHDIEQLYRIARHYALAQSTRHQMRTYEVNIAAGMMALAHAAYDEAYTFFSHVYELAPAVVAAVDVKVEAAFAEACFRTGRITEALKHYEQAISNAHEPLFRAQIRVQRLEINAWLDYIDLNNLDILLAFQELEYAYSTHAWHQYKQITSSIVRVVKQTLLKSRKIGSLERETILVQLLNTLTKVAYLRGDKRILLASSWSSLALAKTLGDSAELAETYALHGWFMSALGMKRLGNYFLSMAHHVACRLENPTLLLVSKIYAGIALNIQGHAQQSENILQQLLMTPQRTISILLYSHACLDLIWNLWLRGHIYDAWEWNHRVIDYIRTSSLQHSIPMFIFLPLSGAALLITLGNPTEADVHIRRLNEYQAAAPQDIVRLVTVTTVELAIMLEQGDSGPALDALLQTGQTHSFINVAKRVFHLHQWFVLQAYARLSQVSQASGRKRKVALKRFGKAIKQLQMVAKQPVLKAHYLVLAGAEKRLNDDLNAALELLGQAETLAYQVDSAWVQMQVAIERALLLQEQRHYDRARHEALHAWQMASAHGWNMRAQAMYDQFDLHDHSLFRHADTQTQFSDSEMLRLQRQLEALLRVILSWTSVRNPAQQAQVALDVIVQILGAERASLFLYEQERLVFRAGRDASGNDLQASDHWSTALLERVRVTRQPIVVRSHDDEMFVNLESSEQMHVRSVLAAPLIFEDRLLGVLYLDNRLIWGVFSDADIEVLLAIANHVALGLETSRTAQLEISIESERRQRLLAEQLRQISTTLNSSLELEVVFNQSLQALQQLISYEQAAILFLEDADCARYVAVYGYAHPEIMRQTVIQVAEDSLLQSVMNLKQAVLMSELIYLDPLAIQAGPTCLGLPLIVRDGLIGFVLLRQTKDPVFRQRDAELGMVFAAQAAIAIDNARLFGEVQRLAITDGLTQVWNRRYLFELSEREWNRTVRYDHPLSALMIDVDHFKSINDTYGHATGDHVLATLVAICRAQLRITDELGRYGGEEFAVLLPDTDLSAAYETAERLRAAVEQTMIYIDQRTIKITISVGVASKTTDMLSVAALFDRADRGLYFAKEMGRNRVMMA